jgi:site-specific recombinase XerD
MMKPFKRAGEEAGLEAVSNTIRYMAIKKLFRAGVNFPTVQKVLDHETLAMVDKYAHQNGGISKRFWKN